MELELYQQHNDVFIQPKGRIVLEHVNNLKATCLPLASKGTDQLIIDLSQVDFIDSAGLGALVSLKMAANRSRSRVVLLQPSKSVADVLYISKLDGIFDIMSGAEAEMLRAQLVQPKNRLAPGSQAQAAAATAPLPVMASAKSSAAAPAGGTLDAQHPEGLSPKEQVEAHFKRASDHMRQEKFDLAVQEYQAALQLDAEYLPALNNLAVVYEKRPSWHALAITQWEQVLALSQRRGDQKHVDRAQRHLDNLRKMA